MTLKPEIWRGEAGGRGTVALKGENQGWGQMRPGWSSEAYFLPSVVVRGERETEISPLQPTNWFRSAASLRFGRD